MLLKWTAMKPVAHHELKIDFDSAEVFELVLLAKGFLELAFFVDPGVLFTIVRLALALG